VILPVSMSICTFVESTIHKDGGSGKYLDGVVDVDIRVGVTDGASVVRVQERDSTSGSLK